MWIKGSIAIMEPQPRADKVSGTDFGHIGRRKPFSVSDTNGTRIRINVLRINDLRSTLTSIRFIELYINNIE